MSPAPGQLSVIPADVRELGTHARTLAQTLQSALNSAGHEVDSLKWHGSAGDSYHRSWGECRENGAKILSALNSMAEKLGATSTAFQAEDTSLAHALNIPAVLDIPTILRHA